mmetsp:Transcript_48540/g.113818  ORF Transcript_48540/g.113818 Transcript_48540/m.113818 type:complete len:213 (-) Transcript_48540:1308-1946(-)
MFDSLLGKRLRSRNRPRPAVPVCSPPSLVGLPTCKTASRPPRQIGSRCRDCTDQRSLTSELRLAGTPESSNSGSFPQMPCSSKHEDLSLPANLRYNPPLYPAAPMLRPSWLSPCRRTRQIQLLPSHQSNRLRRSHGPGQSMSFGTTSLPSRSRHSSSMPCSRLQTHKSDLWSASSLEDCCCKSAVDPCHCLHVQDLHQPDEGHLPGFDFRSP